MSARHVTNTMGSTRTKASIRVPGSSGRLFVQVTQFRGSWMELAGGPSLPMDRGLAIELDGGLYLGVVASQSADGRAWIKVESTIPNLDALRKMFSHHRLDA